MAPTPLFMGPFLFRALARSFTQLVEKKIQYANEIDLAALVVISFLSSGLIHSACGVLSQDRQKPFTKGSNTNF